MQKAEFSPRRLGHVNLWVSDLEKSVRFFESVCGVELVRRERDLNIAFHSNGNTHHDVGIVETSRGQDRFGRNGLLQIPKERGLRAGLNHLGWEMEHEKALVEAYWRATQANVRIARTVDHIISRSVYVTDPDGNTHEFYADSLQDWRSVFNLDDEGEVTADWTPPQESPEPSAHYPLDPQYRRVDSAPLHATHVVEVTLGTSRFDAMLAFFQDVAGLRVLDLSRSPSRHAVLSGGLGRPDLVLEEQPEGDAGGLLAATFALSEAASPEAVSEAARALDSPIVRRRDFRGTDVIVLRSPDDIEIRLREPASVATWL